VKPLYFSMDQVWKHCQSVAQSAKRIAELLSNDLEVARNAYTAGLLHDIGKLALALNFEEQYQGALKLAEKQKLLPSEVESQVFSANHAEAGAYLLSQWGLPLPIVEAVADHHLPAKEVNKVFSAATALHIAERLEYAEHLARNNIKDVAVDLDYPAELQLSGRMDELRRIVRGEEDSEGARPESSEGTMIFTRSQLKSNPVALPASGDPTPMLAAVFTDKKKPSHKLVLAVIGSVAVLLAIAVAFGLIAPRKKVDQVARAEKPGIPEHRNDSRGPRSNLPAETSRKIEAPVQKAPEPEPEFPELKVQAIMYNGAKSSLVINGRSCHLGDEIEGVRIVGVLQDEVTVERSGLQRKLKLR